MRLECEVIAVEGNGETLSVKLQGSTRSAAAWRNMEAQTIKIPETPKSQRVFHLGRRVLLTVEAR